MADIIPAIIPTSYDNLVAKVAQVKGLVELVQIDVLDGLYIKESSWPYNRTNTEVFIRMTEQEEGLPYWSKLTTR